jgi:Lrp/AsnC family transcriptional regulator
MRTVLDKIDLKILDLMQKDASLSTAELAGRVGLSQSPCWRRVQRLQDEGYIKAQVALVDWQKLGFMLQIFALVKMATRVDGEVSEFIQAVNDIPEIMECYSLFGERDFMLKIIAPDVKWYQDFVFVKLRKLPGVADVQSMVTLLEAKFTTAVPVEPLPSAPQP